MPPAQQQQGIQQQVGPDSTSPAPFAQQGAVEGTPGAGVNEGKTTLWYVEDHAFRASLDSSRCFIIRDFTGAPANMDLQDGRVGAMD